MAKRFDIAKMARYRRDFAPNDFQLEINSHSLLTEEHPEKYESCAFEAGGHKWRLVLYPNTIVDGHGYISLYLEIVSTPSGKWEVDATFKLFVYNQKQKKYFTIEDDSGKVRQFNQDRTKMGFAKAISRETFYDLSEGYLFNDCSIFGAEVFVYKHSRQISEQSFVKQPTIQKFKLKDFSSKSDPDYQFPFIVQGTSWKLRICPKGQGQKNKSLSIFLQSTEDLKTHSSFYAEFKLRVLDQVHPKKSIEKTVKHWFCSSKFERGFSSFMPLKALHDTSNGFTKENVLAVEVEILAVSAVKTHVRCNTLEK